MAPACDTKKAKGGKVKVTSHAQVAPEKSDAMLEAISKGVVTVTVDATMFNTKSLIHYGSGIFDDASCGT